MDTSIDLWSGLIPELVTPGYDQAEGPVCGVIDDASPGRAAGHVQVGVGKLFSDKGNFLTVAKGAGGPSPFVVAQPKVPGFRVPLQHEEIERHIFRGISGSVGQDVKHGEERSQKFEGRSDR